MSSQRLILRLDDASVRMDVDKWDRIELLLDRYGIKPLVGIIPECRDSMMEIYSEDDCFWEKVKKWLDKDWVIAMHGYQHVYETADGGANPVNNFSEFAGLPLENQINKIRRGYRSLTEHGVFPKVFFAPGHTFDDDTLNALISETPIRVISDTIAWDVYKRGELIFIPQQSGSVRKLPFKTCTYAYHPNTMDENAFYNLEQFLSENHQKFVSVDKITVCKRRLSFLDKLLQTTYFAFRRIRTKIR